MTFSELKSIIAQNCEEYNSYNILHLISMGAQYRTCSNCSNYIKEKCIKGLQDEMKEKLSKN